MDVSAERQFLTGLPTALAEKIWRLGQTVYIQAGAMVHQAGDPSQTISLVQSGRIAMSRTSRGGERIVTAIIGPGESFGLFTLLTARPRSHDAYAIEPSRVLVLPRRRITDLIDSEPLVRERVIASLSERLGRALDALEDERRLPLAKRLAKRLIEYADAEGKIGLTQLQLAEELGVSRYAIGLAIKTMAERHFIAIGYGKLRVLNQHGLKNWAMAEST